MILAAFIQKPMVNSKSQYRNDFKHLFSKTCIIWPCQHANYLQASSQLHNCYRTIASFTLNFPNHGARSIWPVVNIQLGKYVNKFLVSKVILFCTYFKWSWINITVKYRHASTTHLYLFAMWFEGKSILSKHINRTKCEVRTQIKHKYGIRKVHSAKLLSKP